MDERRIEGERKLSGKFRKINGKKEIDKVD